MLRSHGHSKRSSMPADIKPASAAKEPRNSTVSNTPQTQASGENVRSKEIRKHRNDVFRLVQLLRTDARIALPEPIRRDLQRFVDQTASDNSLDPMAFHVPFSRDDAVDILREVYRLT